MDVVENEYRDTMEFTPPLDYTEAYTHKDRLARNSNKLYLRQEANKTVDGQFQGEQNNSFFPIDDSPPVREMKVKEVLNSGINPSIPNLIGSASIVTQTEQPRQLWHGLNHDIRPYPPPPVEDKNAENLEIVAKEEAMPDITKKPPISSSIIRNNEVVSQGVYPVKKFTPVVREGLNFTYTIKSGPNIKSASIVRGIPDSKPFGKITNVEPLTAPRKDVPICEPSADPLSPILPCTVQRDIPTPSPVIVRSNPGKSKSFSIIRCNPKTQPFGRII